MKNKKSLYLKTSLRYFIEKIPEDLRKKAIQNIIFYTR